MLTQSKRIVSLNANLTDNMKIPHILYCTSKVKDKRVIKSRKRSKSFRKQITPVFPAKDAAGWGGREKKKKIGIEILCCMNTPQHLCYVDVYCGQSFSGHCWWEIDFSVFAVFCLALSSVLYLFSFASLKPTFPSEFVSFSCRSEIIWYEQYLLNAKGRGRRLEELEDPWSSLGHLRISPQGWV